MHLDPVASDSTESSGHDEREMLLSRATLMISSLINLARLFSSAPIAISPDDGPVSADSSTGEPVP